jgi:hypothetical protein
MPRSAPSTCSMLGALALVASFARGATAGIATTPWHVESNQAEAALGWAVASAGDVDGDGYDDVIASAAFYTNGELSEGRAYLYQGSASGLSKTASWRAESDQAGAVFGYSVASAGDVNGDGYDDVIVGARLYANGQPEEGKVFVYYGSFSGLRRVAAWTAESDQDNAYFGQAVSSAGDVNGDGFGDVAIGALYADDGEVDEGMAFVYLGSPSGLESAPAWTGQIDQPDSAFGADVSSAGDVNGDGFDDLIVGAGGYDDGETDEGAAFLYLGSASGLETTPAWMTESDQDEAVLGNVVAGLGDVNGDGYADVAVGADLYSHFQVQEGRVTVFLGFPGGLRPRAAWVVESDQDYAFLGKIGPAGDTNGDGYDDVIVGAPYYDDGESDEGRVYLYEGSATGLDHRPAASRTSNFSTAGFGHAVSGAGDVNGDGYADIVVGAPGCDHPETQEGRVYVYLGAP